jgi:hypothetical protein
MPSASVAASDAGQAKQQHLRLDSCNISMTTGLLCGHAAQPTLKATATQGDTRKQSKL